MSGFTVAILLTHCFSCPSFQMCPYLLVIAAPPKTRETRATSIITVTTRHAHISFTLLPDLAFKMLSRSLSCTTCHDYSCLSRKSFSRTVVLLPGACALCSTVRSQFPNLTTDPCSTIPIVLRTQTDGKPSGTDNHPRRALTDLRMRRRLHLLGETTNVCTRLNRCQSARQYGVQFDRPKQSNCSRMLGQ